MSAASAASGARRVSTPGSGTSGFRNAVESTSSMPSDWSTRATPPISESVFFTASDISSLAMRQSGRMLLKILLCFTCPAITALVTRSSCSRSIALPNSPRLTQCRRAATRSSSGEASSRTAITAMSMPRLRAPSSTRNGKRPLPAMRPQRSPAEVGSREAEVSAPGVMGRLLRQTALSGFDEADKLFDVGRAVERDAHLLERLRRVQLRAQEQPIGLLDHADALGVEPAALQANRVHAEAARLALGDHQRKRRHVLRDHGRSPDVGVAPDAAVLVHGTERAQAGVVFDRHVAGKRGAVGKDGVVAHAAIVCDVRIGHEEIVAADAGDAAALPGAAADGDELAEDVRIAGRELGALAAILQVLRVAADRAKGMEDVPAPKPRRAVHGSVRMQHAIFAQLDLVAHDGVRADAHARPQPDTRRNNGAGIDFAHCGSHWPPAGSRSTILHIRVASAASSPFTEALPSSLQKSPRKLSTLTSICNWSPGSTGRRKR